MRFLFDHWCKIGELLKKNQFLSFKRIFQWKPKYLLWWLIYQGVFIFVTAGIVVLFFGLKNEKFGFLSLFNNYLTKILITLFVSIYLMFLLLLIYFWFNVLSLMKFLKKGNTNKSLEGEHRVDLTSDLGTQGFSSNAAPIQLLPLSLNQNLNLDENGAKENSKFFVLHV